MQVEPDDWEQIGKGPTIGSAEGVLYRLKVPGGWLVLHAFERTDLADSMTFYPDPKHEWSSDD